MSTNTDEPINEWQINEVHEALKEADKGEFASNEEVMSFFKKWNVDLTKEHSDRCN